MRYLISLCISDFRLMAATLETNRVKVGFFMPSQEMCLTSC